MPLVAFLLGATVFVLKGISRSAYENFWGGRQTHQSVGVACAQIPGSTDLLGTIVAENQSDTDTRTFDVAVNMRGTTPRDGEEFVTSGEKVISLERIGPGEVRTSDVV